MRGLNQVDLAKASGVAQNTISEIETGRREARPATLGKLARALGVDIADFFEEPTYPKKARSPLSVEWALSLADEDAFQRDITDALSQDLRDLMVALVGDYQPRLFENVRDKKPSAEDGRRAKAFSRAYSIAEELRRRGEETPESYILALRRHINAMTSPDTHHVQESRDTA